MRAALLLALLALPAHADDLVGEAASADAAIEDRVRLVLAHWLEGKFEVPDDAYNGMLTLILKNLPAGAGDTVSMVAFTPKPRVVKLRLTPMADEQVTLNESPMQAARYIVKPELGFFASLLLFDLPSLRCWILPGEAPAFLKAEGPLYFMGPVWRIEPF